MLKKQAQNASDTNAISAKPNGPDIECDTTGSSTSEPIPCINHKENIEDGHQSSVEERSQFRGSHICRTPPVLQNVAMHIDPTYLSQQSSSMPNSLIFQGNYCHSFHLEHVRWKILIRRRN